MHGGTVSDTDVSYLWEHMRGRRQEGKKEWKGKERKDNRKEEVKEAKADNEEKEKRRIREKRE